jgi:hypothetical protein
VVINGTPGDDVINIRFDGAVGAHRSRVNGVNVVHPFALAFVVNGFGGNDTIDGQSNLLLNGLAGDLPLQVPMVAHGGLGMDTILGGDGPDVLNGDADDDKIEGHGGEDTINGGPGCDRLFGGEETDTIDGGLGGDLIVGGEEADFLCGNLDNDVIWGDGQFCCPLLALATDGGDVIDGGGGEDTIFGCGGFDSIQGGPDKDRIWGYADLDVLCGQGGPDKIFGGFGGDVIGGGGELDCDAIFGEHGDDLVCGGPNDDRIFGGIGEDTLSGNDGNDKVFGQQDPDVLLEGDAGDDLVVGGPDVADPLVAGNAHFISDTCAECPAPDACATCELCVPGVAVIGAADPVTATFDPETQSLCFDAALIDWLADSLSVQDIDMFVAIDPSTQAVLTGAEFLARRDSLHPVRGLECADPLLGSELRLSPLPLIGRGEDGSFLFGDGRLQILSPTHEQLLSGRLVEVALNPETSVFGARLSDAVINEKAGSGLLSSFRASIDRGNSASIWILDTQATEGLLGSTNGFETPGSATGAGEICIAADVPSLGDGCPFDVGFVLSATVPGVVKGDPRGLLEYSFAVELTSLIGPARPIEPAAGVSGWTVSLEIAGGAFVEATTQGTAVDEFPGSAVETEIVSPGRTLARSTVALRGGELLASGTVPVLRVIARAAPPQPGDPELNKVFISFSDRLVETAENTVQYRGQAFFPALVPIAPTEVLVTENQIPGDCNQDGSLDISDGVCLLGHLFLGTPAELPCEGGSVLDPGNLALLDANGDGNVDLSDPIRILAFLFLGSPPHVLGTQCRLIPTCPPVCGPRPKRRPDLVMDFASVPLLHCLSPLECPEPLEPTEVRQPFRVDVETANRGAAAAGPFVRGIELLSRTGQRLTAATAEFTGIAAGQTLAETFGFSFSGEPLAPGDYLLVLFVDPENEVEESVERNNAAVLQITIVP